MSQHCNPIPKGHRLCCFLMVLSFLFGIYVGSTTIQEKTSAQVQHSSEIMNNCLEVMIGRKSWGKMDQKAKSAIGAKVASLQKPSAI